MKISWPDDALRNPDTRFKGDGMKSLNDKLKRVNIEDIAEDLIAAAHRIHQYRITIALGQDPPEGFEKGNKDYQQMIVEQVAPFIENYEQNQMISANSSSAVVTLLSKGKISPKDAIALLTVLKTKMIVEQDEMELSLKKKLIKEIDNEEKRKNAKDQCKE